MTVKTFFINEYKNTKGRTLCVKATIWDLRCPLAVCGKGTHRNIGTSLSNQRCFTIKIACKNTLKNKWLKQLKTLEKERKYPLLLRDTEFQEKLRYNLFTMAEKELLAKLANVPMARPGFDALGMSAPVLVQMNPDGKWENSKPGSLDEERLRAVVHHLTKSNALNAAQSYCVQCAAENQKTGGTSNYVPVIMMPIYPADQCPFDMDCEVEKLRQAEAKQPKKSKKAENAKEEEEKETDSKKKTKKRGFVMQRLNDFDLLSQW